MKMCSLTRGEIAAKILELHKQVDLDLSRLHKRLKSDEQKIQEPGKVCVKQEPLDSKPSEMPVKTENDMTKAELIALHNLDPNKKSGAFGKRCPVHCPHCNKVFEGGKRARIRQHTEGQEHRLQWKKAGGGSAKADPDIKDGSKQEQVVKVEKNAEEEKLDLKVAVAYIYWIVLPVFFVISLMP
jgi:hypothetical protein